MWICVISNMNRMFKGGSENEVSTPKCYFFTGKPMIFRWDFGVDQPFFCGGKRGGCFKGCQIVQQAIASDCWATNCDATWLNHPGVAMV